MPLTALTNTGALQAQGNISKNADLAQQAMARISSGSRIVKASDDTASAAINNKVSSLIAGLNQAISNTSQGASLLQVATGGLTNLADILTRMRVLATQVNSEVLGQEERDFADLELQQLLTEFDDIVDQTRFNGSNLLTGGPTTITDKTLQAAATFTRDANQSISTNSFTGAMDTTVAVGAITGTASEATVVANAAAGNDYTLVIDTGKGTQTFTATGVTAVANGTLDLTSSDGNIISFTLAADVSDLTAAADADNAFKQLVSLTPGSTAATFVSKNDGFNATTGLVSADAEKAIANGDWTLFFDSAALGTQTAQNVGANAVANLGAPFVVDSFAAAFLNAGASTGEFTGDWTSTTVTANGANYDIDLVVTDQFGSTKTFQIINAAVADGGQWDLVSTTAGDTSQISIDLHANALTTGNMGNVVQVQAAFDAARGNNTAFTSVSQNTGGAFLATITTTDAFADQQYSFTYDGVDTFTLRDGTGASISTVTLTAGQLAAPDGESLDFDIAGGKKYTATLGVGFNVATAFQTRFEQQGADAQGHTLSLDDGRGNKTTLTDIAIRNDEVLTFTNGLSVVLGSAFDSATDKQVTFSTAQSKSLTFQAADKSTDTVDVTMSAVGTTNVNLTGIDITSIANAVIAQDKIAIALNEVNSVYATLGAQQKRLELAQTNASTTVENLTAAKATFYDADLPAELTNRTIADVQYKASISMLTQANAMQLEILGAIR